MKEKQRVPNKNFLIKKNHEMQACQEDMVDVTLSLY